MLDYEKTDDLPCLQIVLTGILQAQDKAYIDKYNATEEENLQASK